MTGSYGTLTINRDIYDLHTFNELYSSHHRNSGDGQKSNWTSKLQEKAASILTTSRIKDSFKTYFPIVDWLPNYKFKDNFIADLITGLTVAIFQVPQSMGYCLIAHVPPVYGLYTSFFPALLYSIFGTSKHSAFGAFAIVSGVMTGNVVANIMKENGNVEYSNHYGSSSLHSNSSSLSSYQYELTAAHLPDLEPIQVATAISLAIGIYCLSLGVLHFGFISMYLSEALISGFATSASVYVFTSQLRYLFGVNLEYRSGFIAVILSYSDVFEHYKEINPVTTGISVVSISVLLLFKSYVNKKLQEATGVKIPFPIEFFVVISGIVASTVFDLHNKYNVQIVGEIKKGLPDFTLPRKDVLNRVWLPSLPIAAVGYVISLTIAKIYADKHGYEVNPNQELVAIGVSNTVSSCFWCIPSAASLPRSAVQEQAGGKTQMVSLVNCLSILLVLFVFAPLLENLPNCVLGSVIAVALKSLLQQGSEFKKYWRISKLDGCIWLVTFFGVIILDVQIGLGVGVVFSLLVLIFKSSRPSTYILGNVPGSDIYVPQSVYVKAEEVDEVRIYQFCGPLHFANKEFFRSDLLKKTSLVRNKSINHNTPATDNQSVINVLAPEDFERRPITPMSEREEEKVDQCPKILILDCSMISYCDTSGVAMFQKVIEEHIQVGITVYLTGFVPELLHTLERGDFFDNYPRQNVFVSNHDAVTHARNHIRNLQS